jgi:hypothetical protein
VVLDRQFGMLGLEGCPQVGYFGKEEIDLVGMCGFEGCCLLLGQFGVLVPDGLKLPLACLLHLG